MDYMLLIGGCVKSGDWGGKSVCLIKVFGATLHLPGCHCKVLYIYYPTYDLTSLLTHTNKCSAKCERCTVCCIDAVNMTAMSLRIKVLVRIYTKHVNHHVICSKHMDRSIEKCFCVGFASFNLAKRGQTPLLPSPDSVRVRYMGFG